MIEELKSLPPEFLNAHQRKLLEMAAVGLITTGAWEPLTPEQIRQNEWDRRMSNMKAGKSRLDTSEILIKEAA